MVDDSLRIDASVLSSIHTHLSECYPDEGCGFLIGEVRGHGATCHEHVAIENRRIDDGGAARRYLISPSAFRDAERWAATTGYELIGTYHSHPDVPAVPSSYDLEHAWPSYRYLIVSVTAGRVQNQRVWQLENDRSGFCEHTLDVTTFSQRS